MALRISTTILIASTFAIVGCTASAPSKQTTGAAIGGVLGGVAGSQVGGGTGRTVATIAGVLLGAAIGGAVGSSMDQTDRVAAQTALERTRDNQMSEWRNPNTNVVYQVTPTNTYQTSAGEHCREFKTVAVIDGRQETVYGTACRQPDGTWKNIS